MVFRLVLPSDELEIVQLGLSIPVDVFNFKSMITNLFSEQLQLPPPWRNELGGPQMPL